MRLPKQMSGSSVFSLHYLNRHFRALPHILHVTDRSVDRIVSWRLDGILELNIERKAQLKPHFASTKVQRYLVHSPLLCMKRPRIHHGTGPGPAKVGKVLV